MQQLLSLNDRVTCHEVDSGDAYDATFAEILKIATRQCGMCPGSPYVPLIGCTDCMKRLNWRTNNQRRFKNISRQQETISHWTCIT